MIMENYNELQATQLQRSILGTENERKHFIMNGEKAEDVLKRDAQNKFNDGVQEYIDKLDDRAEKVKDYMKTIEEEIDNLEIMPIYGNLLVQPFAENPFQKIQISESGIITDIGGYKPTYKSQEDGEIHEEESFIKVATVIAVGPDCKYIKEGDTIMATKASMIDVPFFKQGFMCMPESRVMAVINNGLEERFKNLK